MSENDLIFCPLECGARIKGLSKHLSKCMNKKLLGKEYKICEYNSYHIIKNNLYDFHLISCPSKKKFEESDNDSDDDDLKIKETSDEEKPIEKNKEEEKEKDIVKEEPGEKNKNVNDEEFHKNIIINRRKRRYNHENALFKDESEIDKECLNFFNKVYI